MWLAKLPPGILIAASVRMAIAGQGTHLSGFDVGAGDWSSSSHIRVTNVLSIEPYFQFHVLINVDFSLCPEVVAVWWLTVKIPGCYFLFHLINNVKNP